MVLLKDSKVKKIFLFLVIIMLGGCFTVGEFTPERHAQHEQGHADCQKTPDRCIHGVPW